MDPAAQAGDLGGHTTAQQSSWGGKFFFMRAFLGTPSVGWKPWQGVPGAEGAGTEGRQQQAQGPGRVPCVHTFAGGFDVTFPSRPCLHGTHQEHGDSRAQVAPEVPEG